MVQGASGARIPKLVAFAAALTLLAVLAVPAFSSGSGSGLPGGHSDYEVSVNKSGTGQGMVTSSPAGISCGETCDGSFPLGTMVRLTATPAKGSKFAGFSGGCVSSSSTCDVSTPSDGLPVSVVAEFAKAPRPTANFYGKVFDKASPLLAKRLVKVRVGCGDADPCDLQVTVFLRFWLPKKGYLKFKAGADLAKDVNRPGGASKRVVTVGTGALGRRMLRSMKLHRRPGTVIVIVSDVNTGARMAINEKGLPGDGPPKKPKPKSTK